MNKAQSTLFDHFLAMRKQGRETQLPPGSRTSPGKGLSLVLEGSLEVHTSASGVETLVSVLGPGSVTGISSLYSENPPDSVLVAGARSLIITFPASIARAEIEKDACLMAAYAQVLNSKIGFLISRIGQLTSLGSEAKLASFLLSNSAAGLTREALAQAAGISRASLYRALSALEAKGAVKVEGGKTAILDKTKLEELACP